MKTYVKLSSFLSEYTVRNTENKYRPVAVGRYGIRTRESIYSKELAKDYSKNKVIGKNTLTVGMGSVQIDIGILTDDVKYSVSPAYHTYTITEINPDYLRYCLECRNQDMFERYVKRGSRQGKTIDLGRWLTYEIPVCSEVNQQEIVSQLDFVESLIIFRREQLAKLDELVKSRFIELFGSVEVNVFGFETIKIKDACDLINGKAFKPEDWSETGLPIVRIQNLNNDQAPFNFFNGEIKEQYLIDTGELLFSWSGTPGTSFGAFFWNRGKAVLNQHIFRVKPKIEFNLSFLQFALNGRIDHIISKAHGGVGLQHITKKELDEVELLLPAIELQNQFAAFFEQTDKSKLAIQESLAELETLKKALMQKYFG